MPTKHCVTLLSPEKHLRFGVIAAQLGMSKAALLRRMVDDYIIRHEKPTGGNFRKGGKA